MSYHGISFKGILSIALIAVSIPVFSQTPVIAPIRFSGMEPLEKIEQAIKNGHETTFSEQEFIQIEAIAKRSQNTSSAKIIEVNQLVTSLLSQQQDLMKISDVAEMQKNLDEKRKNKETIRQDAINELSQISQKGLYLVVLSGIDPYLSKEKLTEQAKASLAPMAIEDIRGVFIQTLMQDIVDSNTKSFIRGTISGQMTVETSYLAEKRNASRKFIYLAKISVTPLKKFDRLAGPGGVSPPEPVVIALSNRGEIAASFSNLLSQEDCIKVLTGIEEIQASIAQENEASEKQKHLIIENTNKHIADLDQDIAKLQTDISTRMERFKQAAQQLTGMPCSEDLNDCVKMVFDNLKEKYASLVQQKIALKENEIITQRTVLMPEGEPSKDIANAVQNLIKQFNTTYGKVEQFLNVNESLLEDGRDESNKMTTQRIDATRTVDSVSLYVNPQDDGSFKVLIAANFKIDNKVLTESEKSTSETLPLISKADGVYSQNASSTTNVLEQDIIDAQKHFDHQNNVENKKPRMKRWVRALCVVVTLSGLGAAGYYYYDWNKNYDAYKQTTDPTTAQRLHTTIRDEEKKIKAFSIVGGIGAISFGVTYAF